MIWDCFIFHDELDLLQCRLETLDGAVDRFVIAEAGMTFQGEPKPLHFLMHERRFSRWRDRIAHIHADTLCGATSWDREAAQRDLIGLADIPPDDLVLLSDVDELPRPEALGRVRAEGVTAFQMKFHCFAVDWLHPAPWQGTLAARRRDIPSFSQLRNQRDLAPRILDAGWHFSWLGSKEGHLRKLLSFSHTELVDTLRPGLTNESYRKHGYHVDGVKLLPVDVDATWPDHIVARRCPTQWFREGGA